jgi:hypothetical protein
VVNQVPHETGDTGFVRDLVLAALNRYPTKGVAILTGTRVDVFDRDTLELKNVRLPDVADLSFAVEQRRNVIELPDAVACLKTSFLPWGTEEW